MRIDNYLVKNNIFDSRTKAKQAIDRNEIFVNGKLISKSSFDIDENFPPKIDRIYNDDFVSVGGFKLNKALNDFEFLVNGMIVADIGASTGGFTDCLLKRGAKKVYAIDLNEDLLHNKLKNDNRVVSIIKNARELKITDFNERLDLIVADLSFISATYVLEVFSSIINMGKNIILLIKPQFETGEKKKFKNGIIRDQATRQKACDNVIDFASSVGLKLLKITTAPISNEKNIEYLALFEKNI